MIKIRLSRGGRVHRPIYTIVAADSRRPRDGRYLEKLGQYDPSAENVLKDINEERVKFWVARGAAMSDTVRSLFKKNKVAL